jgi:L-threonylcarbamoyladenylate synthase
MPRQVRTEVIPSTDPAAIEQALQVLRAGGLIAFATDTVYGVGALPSLAPAVERIYLAKGRPRDKAIPLLMDSASRLEEVAENIPPEASLLAKKFWPGPLTIVLTRKPAVPDKITAGGTSVAVRVPDHPFALRLIAAAGGALATTSANLSGQPDPITAQEVLGYLGGRIDLILDGGRCPGGIPSTVIDLSGSSPHVVRWGAIKHASLDEALGRQLV